MIATLPTARVQINLRASRPVFIGRNAPRAFCLLTRTTPRDYCVAGSIKNHRPGVTGKTISDTMTMNNTNTSAADEMQPANKSCTKRQTIQQTVEANRDAALACKTSQELKEFIESVGCKTKARWSRAVQAIIDIGGVDYYAARGETRAASAETLRSQVSHEVTLFVDAKARCQRFAITDADGHPVWYGRFFDDDRSFSYGDRNEQSACECAAARKAIWFASKIKEAVNATAIRLTLKVDAQWLTTGGGKASILQSDARRFNVELDLQWIAGTSNPADQYTDTTGFMRWSDNDLASLAGAVEPETQSELMPYVAPLPLPLLIAA